MEAPVKIVNGIEHLTIQPAKFTSVVGNMYLMHLLRQFFFAVVDRLQAKYVFNCFRDNY